MKAAVRMFKALADPTRLRIVKLLERGELCVCQLTAALGMGQSRISRHLSVLKQAGLISDRRQGKWVHYQLVRNGAYQLARGCFSQLDNDAVIKTDRLSAMKAKKNPACPLHPPASLKEGKGDG